MTIVSRKKKSQELCWVLRRTGRSRHRRLVFQRDARAYLWRSRRDLSELHNN